MPDPSIRPRHGRDQTCKSCGHAGGLNFHVPDRVWASVVPDALKNRVVCLRCFDRFAKAQGVPYADTIGEIYFAGEAASFKLVVEWAAERKPSG